MGQSHSATSSSQKRRLLITPKKLIRLRRQSVEGASVSKRTDVSNAQNQKKSGEFDGGGEEGDYQSADIVLGSRHSETHTNENNMESSTATTTITSAIPTARGKHNSERAFSHDLSAKEESLIEESLLQLRELIEHLLCSDHSDAPIVIEIDSEEKSLKILPQNLQSSLTKEEEETLKEIPSHHGGKIVIREPHFGTPTSVYSGDSIFVDAYSSPISECQSSIETNLLRNLHISKLEQFNLLEESQKLQQQRNESLVNITHIDNQSEMPIIKNSTSTANGSVADGNDKGIFNVSRVKKVELCEIPLDITSTSAVVLEQQQSVATSTSVLSKTSQNGNGNNSSNSSGNSVLHRVISLTTANHNNNDKNSSQTKPTFISEKLQFSAYEKFEGQMLLNWFTQSIPASMTTSLNENDLNALTTQYCTNLLIAGIIKPLDSTTTVNHDGCFKTNVMYQWTHKAPTVSSLNIPGRLEAGSLLPYGGKTPQKRLDGESKIPKPVTTFTSTPKNRPQTFQISTPENSSFLLNGTESDQKKIAELKQKLTKCDTVKETLILIRSFLNEHAMQSSESSTNSGAAMSSSLLNGSDLTIFNKHDEQRLLNILEKQKQKSNELLPKISSSTSRTSIRTPPKSRTTPSTPTRLTDRSTGRIRRNLSSDSVSSSSSPQSSKEINNGCKRCVQLAATIAKNTSPTAKRFVDKATVMDVEPIEFPKALEMKNVEIQTDVFEEEKKAEGTEEKQENAIAPPPPPMPPPPPLPNNNAPKPPPPPGPPPPPMALNGGPPLPPPMMNNSKGPNPLPPPPASFSGPALRKNAVNPPKPMKPLYWTRIVAPIVSQAVDQVDGSTSLPEGGKKEEEEELWKEIDETVLDNIDEFTELFSRQGVLPKAKESIPLPKVKAIKVLDSKRSQNVGIFVRSIHVDFAEIEHAIYHCDTSVVNQETLQNIMAIKATNDELALIKESIAAHDASDPSPPPLDVPEQFLLKLSLISSSAERISCIVFQDEFEEQCTSVSRKLSIVKNLCEFLLESEDLKEVFSIILTLGNFMNGGNRQRGQADGFGLEILGKLKDVKSKDPKITLLHFIVKTFITRKRNNGCSILDLKLPVPDPIIIDKSLSIDFEECKQQLNALKNKVEECQKTTEKVISSCSEEHIQPFKDKMEAFITMASKKIESRFMKIEECKVVFVKTLKFYKYMPKTNGTIDETTPSQFFEYWTSFTNDFNGIYKKEITLLTNELLKKSRQKEKPQSKPIPQGENNLKARINRLKSRDK